MKLEIQDNNKSHYVFIRDGIAGNKQTVFQMVHLVQNTVNYDKGFNDFVNKFAISQGFTAYTENYQPETVIKSAALLAKKNSKAAKENNVTVVYCQRKFVKKESGMNDGQVKVDYTNSYQIVV